MLYFPAGTREAEGPGREAWGRVSTAKRSTADALWEAINAAALTFRGYGLEAEYDSEAEFHRTPQQRVAPISMNPMSSCLAGHGLPRSF
jgi:hypothetical protein